MAETQKISDRALTKADVELIERMIYKISDDLTVSISRSLERLKERIDATESRLYVKLNDLSNEVAKADCAPSALTA